MSFTRFMESLHRQERELFNEVTRQPSIVAKLDGITVEYQERFAGIDPTLPDAQLAAQYRKIHAEYLAWMDFAVALKNQK